VLLSRTGMERISTDWLSGPKGSAAAFVDHERRNYPQLLRETVCRSQQGLGAAIWGHAGLSETNDSDCGPLSPSRPGQFTGSNAKHRVRRSQKVSISHEPLAMPPFRRGDEGLFQSPNQSAVISPLCPSGASAARRASSSGGSACVKA
jgi:hypothetical protein